MQAVPKLRSRPRLMKHLWVAGVTIVIAAFFLVPLLLLVGMAFSSADGFSLATFAKILTSPKQYRVIANTLIINILSSLFASLLGIGAAYLMAYTDLSGKRMLHRALLLPLFVPGYIITLAWMQFFAKGGVVATALQSILPFVQMPNLYSYGGIIFVFAVTKYPVIYTLTLSTFQKIPLDLELAAALSGCGRWGIFRKVTLPLALSGIANGALLVFLSCLDNFGTAAFLGIPANITVLTTDIYQAVISMPGNSFATASAKSVLLGGMGVVASIIAWRCACRFQTMQTDLCDPAPRIHLSKRAANAVGFGMVAVILSINFVPLFTLVQTSLIRAFGAGFTRSNLTLENYRFVFRNAKSMNAIGNSLLLACATAVLCLIIGTLVAYVLVRRPSPWIKAIDFIISVPYSIPGIILGLSLIVSWAKPLPIINKTIYGTILMLLLSYVVRFTALQLRSSTTAVLQIDRSMEEAGSINGAKQPKIWTSILVPLLTPACLSGMGLVFLSALTELTTSSLLWSAGSETIGVVIYNYTSAGQTTTACAFSVVTLGVIVGFMAVYRLMMRLLKKEKKEASGLS